MIRRASSLSDAHLSRDVTATGQLTALWPLPFGEGYRLEITVPADATVDVGPTKKDDAA